MYYKDSGFVKVVVHVAVPGTLLFGHAPGYILRKLEPLGFIRGGWAIPLSAKDGGEEYVVRMNGRLPRKNLDALKANPSVREVSDIQTWYEEKKDGVLYRAAENAVFGIGVLASWSINGPVFAVEWLRSSYVRYLG
jgi:hypothetical protein